MIAQDASRSERSDAPAFQKEPPNPLQSRLSARASGGRSDPTTYAEAASDGWWYTVTLPDGDTETPTLPHVLWLGPVAVIRPARHGRGDRTGRSNPGVQTNALHGEQRRAEQRRRPPAGSWRQRDGLAPLPPCHRRDCSTRSRLRWARARQRLPKLPVATTRPGLRRPNRQYPASLSWPPCDLL